MTMSSLIEAYTLIPWNKINSCNNSSPGAPPQANNLGVNPAHQHKPTDRTSAGDKHNTITPEGGAKPYPVQFQKKTMPGGNQRHHETRSVGHGHVLVTQPKNQDE